MNAEAEPEFRFLAALPAAERAGFLAELAHDLSVARRAPSYFAAGSEARAAALTELDEIQRGVARSMTRASRACEDARWIDPVLNRVLDDPNSRVRLFARAAWNSLRERWQAVT